MAQCNVLVVRREAAALFQGEHDFRQFANLSPANEYRHPVKRLARCDIVGLPDGFRIEVDADHLHDCAEMFHLRLVGHTQGLRCRK